MTKCIRCGKEGEIGFCDICYYEVYGLNEDEIYEEYVSRIFANENHLNKAFTDSYGSIIDADIREKGLKNPLIIDQKRHLLVGYHRFAHIKRSGVEKVKVIKIKTNRFSQGFFTEGYSNWLFIARLNGKLACSVCRFRDLTNFIDRLRVVHRTQIPINTNFNIEIEAFYLG